LVPNAPLRKKMKDRLKLSENLEDYLEVILELERTNKVARAKDIACKLGVQRGSVTGALKNLGEKGLIRYEPYSYITLTEKGLKIAEKIARHHGVLKDFLTNVLQVDEETADETACRMEHVINEDSINKLVNFINFISACPKTGDRWIQSFVEQCTIQGLDSGKCMQCIRQSEKIAKEIDHGTR